MRMADKSGMPPCPQSPFSVTDFFISNMINFSFEVVAFFYELRPSNPTKCPVFLQRSVNEEGGVWWVFCRT